MSKTPFSSVLSDDKSQVKLTTQAGEFKYSADQASELALSFASLRTQMSPALPETPGDVVHLEGDRWEAYQKLADGSARIYFRLPGLGWSFIHLQEEACVLLAAVLNPRNLKPATPQK